MYYNSVYPKHNQIRKQQNSTEAYIRILHAVPDAPNVDIYADDELIAQDLAYGDYTEYIRVPEGSYKVAIYAAGTKDNPVTTNMLKVNRDTITTVAAAGMLRNIGLLAIPDSTTSKKRNKAMVRFVHLSPDAPAVDITLPDGTVLFADVSFKEMTPYIEVPPMDYTLQARVAGTQDVALTVPNLSLEGNEIYSAYAIGLVGDQPELEALLLTDR